MNPESSNPSWHRDAARIVEELFSQTAPAHWDLLIDLRQQLLTGSDWNLALDTFLAAREDLEADHYLPFYRLRRLLSAGLRLESDNASVGGSLTELLRLKHRSLADATKAMNRDLFESGVDLPCGRLPIRIVERAEN